MFTFNSSWLLRYLQRGVQCAGSIKDTNKISFDVKRCKFSPFPPFSFGSVPINTKI